MRTSAPITAFAFWCGSSCRACLVRLASSVRLQRGNREPRIERDFGHGAERGAFLHLRGVPCIFFYRAAVRMPARTATSANLIRS